LIRTIGITVSCLALAGAGYLVLISRPDATTPAKAAADWTQILDAVPFESFEPVDSSHAIAFPLDHGAHATTPADVWNLAAHLATDGGDDVGLQVSMARIALVPPGEPVAASEWEIRDLWRGHATLVRRGDRKAIGEERFRRGFGGIAGFDDERRELRLDDWSIQFAEGVGDGAVQIAASIGSMAAIELELTPEKPAATPDGGAARAPFIGYAMTRLLAEGTLTTAVGEERVSGVAWFEHVWGDLPFPGGPTATDRLVLQFDDGTELSVTRTRRRDGAGTASVDGFVVRSDGGVARLPEGTTLTPAATWRRAGAESEFPVGWTLAEGGSELSITPLVDDQLQAFVEPIWSGAVTAEGTYGSKPVSAVGMLQLQGYSE
jgi:predicted secreted hydrolase